ncbi:MAG: division/cell wall cluster transcriptional repressor MraZ [Candidatus Neomarinimicrobiota bacterium]|nr:division/cell wall cluster transcriptional repressor MraZ [Candidatus Neomarinimicrobiota bacterium]|tara:strand:- start:4 stop:471 length:468 start_codon:yes stop_codon:yes gene_type:complete
MKNTLYQSFTGEFNNSLDDKNRMNIPAKFRKALDPINEKSFVLTRGFDKCLILYPLNEWQEVESQLSQLSSIRSRDRNFVRAITRHAIPVRYDAQGRIQIPEALIDFSEIKKDITIIGMIKKIELWSPDILSAKENSTVNIEGDDFDDLANEINF